jgi:PAS domain S-box-containing protein
MGARTLMLVPLNARGRTFGVLVLVGTELDRNFGPADLALAEELGARAALAIDNARLLEAERESRRRLQAVLDNANAAICMVDPDGRYLMVNREYERLSGRNADDVRGHTVHEILPHDAEHLFANSQRVLSEKRAHQFEETVQIADGAHTFLSVKFPIFDDAGQPIACGGISTDITERKRAVEALAASQERFAKVFRASTMSICLTRESDGKVVDANQACYELCGYGNDELIGRTVQDLGIWANDEERARALETLRVHGRVHGFQSTLRTQKGELREVIVSLERVEREGEMCILALAQDITGLKRLEARLQRSQKMEAIGRLAGGVAHDFNNILTAIHGYTGLLLDGLPDGALRTDAEHIRRAAARASALANQLLVFGRRQQVQPVVLDPNLAISNLTSMLSRLIGEDIELTTALTPHVGRVQVDYGQLEQVILNLALNARDAMPRGGRLTIATASSLIEGVQSVRISVTDTGEGMSEATRAQIFEPFFTTKDVGKGTGLGLSTVYSIVEQAHGRIHVESAPGQGARFDIELPVVEADETPSQPPGPLPPGTLEHETILVVEDDVEVREFVCLVLELAGYRVLKAESGWAALELVARHDGPIDLMLSDVVMPHMNGRELAAALIEARPGVRIVHMSGYPGDTVERYGDIAPGVPFLQKPFTREVLLQRIAEALGRT